MNELEEGSQLSYFYLIKTFDVNLKLKSNFKRQHRIKQRQTANWRESEILRIKVFKFHPDLHF